MNLTAASLASRARRGLVGAAAGLLALAAGSPAWASREGWQVFDIPAQDASAGLLQLCLAADCDLAFTPRPGHPARTRPVQGRMSWRSALARMLDGTDLLYRFVGARGVRIWIDPAPRVPKAAAPVAPEATEVEALVVVARLSDQIDEALLRKREADVISDGLSAERIGELPAANLAEALQRAPGVAIEREVGEGQFVSVRGLGPLFQSVTLNGAPVAFNENIRNSTQSGRQFRFRALSIELLAGARLIKSSTPDLIDGGIGSNIDIQTAGGLDGEPFAAFRIGGETEARTGRLREDVTAAGRFVSADGDWGVVAGVSQEARNVRYDRFQIMRYSEAQVAGQRRVVPEDVRTTVELEDRRRRSVFLGADWRVSPALEVDFDGLVSTFDNAIREDRLVYQFGQRLAESGAVRRVEDGVVTAAAITDGRIDNNTEFSDQSHLNVVGSLGARVRLGDWRLTPRLSASRAHSRLDTPLQRFSARSGPASYVFDLGDAVSSRRAAQLTTDLDLLDPSRLTLAQLSLRAVESRDDDITAMFDAERPLGWLGDRSWGGLRVSTLRLGAQFSDRSRDYQRRDRRAAPRTAEAGVAGFYGGVTPDDVFADLVGERSTPWAVADFARLRPAFHLPGERDDVVFLPDDIPASGADRQNSYAVGEQVAAAYLRLDFDGQGAGRSFSGNIGARLVGTRTHVEGAKLTHVSGVAQVAPIRFDGDHHVLLPNLNLALDLDAATILRFAASRSITRPSLADLRASTVPASVLVSAVYERGAAAITDPESGVIFSGVGGNPGLTPYVSTNLDLSYEVTRRRTSFSAAVFWKAIDDFVLMVDAPETLTFETRDGSPIEAVVRMARPHNAGQARVAGLELGAHVRVAEGLGVWASTTWTRSRVDGGGRLPGVSDVAWTLSPYLERGPLALNLSWSWRSAFRSEVDMQGGGVSEFVVGAAGYLDAQASYQLSTRAELTLAASNITDTRELAYEGSKSRLLQLGSVGRRLSLGLRCVW